VVAGGGGEFQFGGMFERSSRRGGIGASPGVAGHGPIDWDLLSWENHRAERVELGGVGFAQLAEDGPACVLAGFFEKQPREDRAEGMLFVRRKLEDDLPALGDIGSAIVCQGVANPLGIGGKGPRQLQEDLRGLLADHGVVGFDGGEDRGAGVEAELDQLAGGGGASGGVVASEIGN